MSVKNLVALILWGIAGYLSGFNDCEFKDRDGLKGMVFWMSIILTVTILEWVEK